MDTESQTSSLDNSSLVNVAIGEASEGEPFEPVEIDPIIQKYQIACQQGDLATVTELIESGAVDIKADCGPDHVTGLHWAAINNRLQIIKYLISKGADINAQGGDLGATPLHWAARYGYVYIVDCFLQHKADYSLVDGQGYNILHLAVHSSNVLLVIYILLFCDLDIDSQDPNGRTSLLWAAYQGDYMTVEVLLSRDANISIKDNGGFSPLHWACVKGSESCIKQLIQKGADVWDKTDDGKNCFIIGQDLNTTDKVINALYESGYDEDGIAIKKYIKDPLHGKCAAFIVPFGVLGLVLYALAHWHVLFTLLLCLGLYFVLNIVLSKVILPSFVLQRKRAVLRSPMMSGIFAATVFWCVVRWCATILPATWDEAPVTNLFLLLTIVLLVFSFYKTMSTDPGIVPVSTQEESRESVKDLLATGHYDARHFCVKTLTRIPLRAKYSFFSKGLVSRFDHYCPWVYNDVGFRNHKVFQFFILSLLACIVLYVNLSMEYFDEIESSESCHILSEELCSGWANDRFNFWLMWWACLNVFWLIALVFTQTYQVFKGATTAELAKSTDRETFATVPDEMKTETPAETVPIAKAKGFINVMLSLFGIDQFLRTIKESRHSVAIDTNYGVKQNLIDFWLTSDVTAPMWKRFISFPHGSKALLGGVEVDYYKLYELPPRQINYEDIV